jgi:predicted peroxiredoxin
MELEGTMTNVGELIEMAMDIGVRFCVCHAFMPGFGVGPDTLIKGAEVQSSAYLGEMLLDGYVPFSLSI